MTDTKYINRLCNLNNILFDIGDVVSLPLEEEGVIYSIDNTIPWGFNVEVMITKGTFNDVGEIVQFRKQDLDSQ